MNHRKDRKPYVQTLQATFPDLRLFDPPLSTNGQQGCYESHSTIMQLALQENIKVAVIFEDDAIEAGNADIRAVVEQCKNVLLQSNNDILYLGCFPDIFKHFHTSTSNQFLFQVRATQTHAYMVHERFMKKFCSIPYSGTPVDEYFRDHAKCLAWLPGLYVQENSKSNVSTKQTLSVMPYKNTFVYVVQLYAAKIGIPLYLLCVSLMFVGLLLRIKYGRR
jgi:GR25 family glycosyltransferase involved in LPS biosynthesis